MQPIPDYTLSVSEHLKSLTASGSLQIDSAQMDVAKCLDRVLFELKRRRPAAKASSLGWLFAPKKKTAEAHQGSLYSRQRRPRQDNADGHLLWHGALSEEAPRAFP